MKSIGVDLGTTNTVVAVDGEPLRLAGADAVDGSLASVVAFLPTGERLYGQLARQRRGIDAKNTIYSAKRIIGQSWFSVRTRQFHKQYPFDLIELDGGPAFSTRAGAFTPAHIATSIVGAVCERADIEPAEHAVTVGVPMMFGSEQQRATAEACGEVGFGEVQLLQEPVATALAYAADAASGLGRVAVYDFGGGTFDLAILDCTSEPFGVLAAGGDAYVGGDDIDYALTLDVAGEVLRDHRWDLRSEVTVFEALLERCEQAKIQLCEQDEVVIDLADIDPSAPLELEPVVITQARLEEIASSLVRSTFSTCAAVLADSRLKISEIDMVLLAGGTTLLPMVRHAVGQHFDCEPRIDIDPTKVVAIGASKLPQDWG